MELIIEKLKRINEHPRNKLYIVLFDNGTGELVEARYDETYLTFESINDLVELLDEEIEDIENEVAEASN